jgi:hypothetical protein
MPVDLRNNVLSSAPAVAVTMVAEPGSPVAPQEIIGDNLDTHEAVATLTIDPAATPVAEFAIMDIANGPDTTCYIISFVCKGIDSEYRVTIKRPSKAYHEIFKQPPADLWTLIRRYASNKELVKLLKSLRQKPDIVGLVIEDRAGCRFPWEMFPLEQDGRTLLGAVLPITHWHPIISDPPDVQASTLLPQVNGKVLAYFSDGVSKAEMSYIKNQLQGTIHDEDIASFKQELRTSQEQYGLVYLACHGILGEGLEWVTLGSNEWVAKRLKYSELSEGHFDLFKYAHSIVFINACFSGIDTDELGEWPASFPDAFVGKGASGVIATLGAVEDQIYAPQVATELLEAIRQTPGLSIAEALRRMREKVLKDLPEDLTVLEDFTPVRKILSRFMYIYFGNPRTGLKLL